MKKRISLLLLVFVLACSLFGCGSKENADLSDYDTEMMGSCADMLIQSFQMMSEEELASFKDASDFELEYMLMASGLPIDKDDFLVMVDAWQAAVDEYGALIDYGEYTAEMSGMGDIVLTAEALFENQEADLVFNFDEKSNMTSMTVDVHYSIGEILKKAGLNTLLGMGTVFVVLIFIAFIISLFRFIPAIENKFKGQKEEPVKNTVSSPPAAETITDTEEELLGDAELVAVIAAAIAAAEETTPDGFIVRSIRRRSNNHWK